MVNCELGDDNVPKQIKEYVRNNPHIEVTEYLERGAIGEVYFGKRIKLDDAVALKFNCSNRDFDKDEEGVILLSIENDNVLRIWDMQFVPPYYSVFISPRIIGGDLRSLIEKGGVSSKSALKIIEGVLLGLTELHSKHLIVHRDLKPDNILIREEDGKVIIADLGAVKKIKDSNLPVSASKATYLYLPPESILKNEYYIQSDIYQVGLILYQLLDGFFPVQEPILFLSEKEGKKFNPRVDFANGSFDLLIGKKIKSGSILNFDSLPKFLGRDFLKVLKKSLHKDYDKRYKTTAHFLKEIHYLIRKSPDYQFQDDKLHIRHDTKEFRISSNGKGEVLLEKKLRGKSWRNENNYDGTYEGAVVKAKNG
jgi:serine/threonine protein kinase